MSPLPGKLPASKVASRSRSSAAWHLPHLGIDQMQSRGLRGSGVTVAVVDTGVDATMPGLSNARARITALDRTGAAGGDDNNGHGTSMIGILVGNDAAVCPDVSILSLQTFSASGSATASWLVDGIETALREGADLISISGGQSSPDTRLADAVKKATDAGVPIVAASDNDAPYDPLYPACVPPAIAVASSDKKDRLVDPGPPGWINLAAPGVAIATISWDQPALLSGTSEATAVVAGVCALLLGTVKGKKRTELGKHLLGFLQKTAIAAANSSGPGDCGIIQPLAALREIQNWS